MLSIYSIRHVNHSLAVDSESNRRAENYFLTKVAQYALETIASLGANHLNLMGAAAFATGTAYFFYRYRLKTRVPTLDAILKMVQDPENMDAAHVQLSLRQFINQELSLKSLQGHVAFSEDSKKFLGDKINKILNATGSSESKKTIIQNILKNFIKGTELLYNRIRNDLESGQLSELGVDEREIVTECAPMGDETHNQGKVPYKILFKSGKIIVYKPRSMLPEQLICDSEQGILRHEQFGTYRVLCRGDSEGDYGYCQFLENKQQENTIKTQEELQAYVKKIEKLELIAKGLGLSDLHYQNVITEALNPCIIDAEVFLNPLETESGLFEDNGPLQLFANEYSKPAANCIWIEEEMMKQIVKQEPRNRRKIEVISKNCWRNLGFDFDRKCQNVALRFATSEQIKYAKNQLRKKFGRYVLVPTTDFIDVLNTYTDERTTAEIFNIIKSHCQEAQFKFLSRNKKALIEAIQYDVVNNDCPVTLFKRDTGRIYYYTKGGGIPIGKSEARPYD